MKISRRSPYFLFLVWALGIGLMATHLVSLRVGLHRIWPSEISFWLGGIFFSSSLTYLWRNDRENTYSMRARALFIFLSACFVAAIPFIRFFFYGTDLVGEYYVAETTFNLQRWPSNAVSTDCLMISDLPHIDTIHHLYFSCLSVTVFPTIFAQTTGLSIMNSFRLLIPMTSATVILGVFLIARRCFDRRVAGLSSIVVIFHSTYLSNSPEHMRQNIALFFFLLALYFILQKKSRYTLLSFIALSALSFSHYTIIYFMVLSLLLVAFWSNIYNYLRRVTVLRSLFKFIEIKANGAELLSLSPYILAFGLMVGSGWLVFVASPHFSESIGVIKQTFQMLLGVESPRYGPFTRSIFVSSLGFFHTIVVWIVRCSIVTGFMISFKLFRKSMRTSVFTFLGGSYLLLLLLFAVLPNIGIALFLDRVYGIFFPFFSVFIALSLLELRKKLGKCGGILVIILITTIFLESIGYPIYYRPESSLSITEPVMQRYYTASDLAFASWCHGKTDESVIFSSDILGGHVCMGFAHRFCLQPRVSNSSELGSVLDDMDVTFFVLVPLNYSRNQGGFARALIFYGPLGVEQVRILLDPNPTTQLSKKPLGQVYDNNRVSLLHFTQSNE